MRVAAPVFPNFMHSDQLVLGRLHDSRVVELQTVPLDGVGDEPRIRFLQDHGVAVLVCGGIEHELLAELRCRGIDVIHNVAGDIDEVLHCWAEGTLRPGYGILYRPESSADPTSACLPTNRRELAELPTEQIAGKSPIFDCVSCASRACLTGRPCRQGPQPSGSEPMTAGVHQLMTAALDISAEPERVLCRIAELVYFCVEMQYAHVGLAFCADLFDESETVTRLLQRFVRVTPVCCRLGGPWEPHSDQDLCPTCNPVAMARALNDAATDLNIAIGLSIGCDVVFSQLSQAPVTTLFVKDKLLANNPVSACHSRYVLERILSPS